MESIDSDYWKYSFTDCEDESDEHGCDSIGNNDDYDYVNGWTKKSIIISLRDSLT